MRHLLIVTFLAGVAGAGCGKVLTDPDAGGDDDAPDASVAPDAEPPDPDARPCPDDDNDDICNADDACPDDPGNDPDGDGVCAAVDVCNGNDATGDTDGDLVCNDLDACRGDDATGDADVDEICTSSDPCPSDGTQACITECVIAFDDQWFLHGEQYDPNTYYSTYGVGFDNTSGYGLIGGMGNGDPGNWDIEGSHGSVAWGMWPGPHSITFTGPTANVRIDFLRGFDDITFNVEGYLDGVLYDTVAVNLSGAFDVETVTFPSAVDEVRWNYSGYFGVDNIRFVTTTACPPAVNFCRAAFDDARAALGDGSNPDTFYSPYGLRFDNAAGYGVIGGVGNGDPGNWDIEGSYGSAAWGLWPGAHDIRWEAIDAMGVKVDYLRGFTDYNFNVEGRRDGAVVQNAAISLVGAFNTKTATFTVPIDRVAWNVSGYFGVDNIRWMSYGACPP